MWKVLLAFVGHRVLLLAAVVVSLQLGAGGSVGAAVMAKAATLPEASALEQASGLSPVALLRAPRDPFLTAGNFLMSLTGLFAPAVLLLLGNLVFLLFLWELHTLVGRVAQPEVAVGTGLLAILWPASYEMSLGSSFSLACLFSAMAVRHALDNKWLVAGLALGGLALCDLSVTAHLPLLAVIFWYFQRHFQWQQVVKRAVFGVVPLALVCVWKYGGFPRVAFSDSALLNLFSAAGSGAVGWTFSHPYLGPTIALALFSTGAVMAALGNLFWLHKLVPVSFFVALVLSSPYGALASRALMAAPALQGIAGGLSRPILGWIQGLMLVAGLVEIYAVFQ